MRPGSIAKTNKSKKNLLLTIPTQDRSISPTFAYNGPKFEFDDNEEEAR